MKNLILNVIFIGSSKFGLKIRIFMEQSLGIII